ncbi:MAG: hypothetical protein KAH10_05125 [Flavobacteriales bacterium]|nr:hypothetical protein [Flavobacteriales bacterium]
MNYGNFTDGGREYKITDPRPPRDWFNFLWNPTYMASVGQNLNGFSLYQNEDGVLTNLFGKQDDRTGPRNIYIRDNETGEVWSAAYHSTRIELDEYSCTHGLGYTTLESKKNGIKVTFQIFVPRKESGEIWSVTVANESGRKRDISVFNVAKVILDGVNLTYGYQTAVDAYPQKEKQRLYFRNRSVSVMTEKYRAFTYTDVPYDHHDVSRDEFLGHDLGFDLPKCIIDGQLTDSTASAEFMVSALQHNLSLESGAEQRINIVMGVVFDEKEADEFTALYANSELIDQELEIIKNDNLSRLGLNKIDTPDADFNNLFNIWLKHQLYLMSDWARFYFKGYRDTLQDSAGIAIIDPDRALSMLEKALINQKNSGFCPRAFRVRSMEVAAADKHYSDSPTWISHATYSLLRETGDLSMLDRVVKYSDSGEDTIWEHNLRALDFLWNDRGEKGLALIRHGDWNDLMDKVGAQGKGEGVWMSIAFARALKVVEEIAVWKGDKKIEEQCATRYNEIKKNILKHGWDEDHFIYAFTDAGNKVGDNASEEGQVFINPQSWAVLAGIIDADKYEQIMKKVEPMVDTKVGPVHNWPPFTKYNKDIGSLTGIPEGNFTNGNVYCHAASFKIAADYAAGRNDKAFETFKRILPSAERSEPYAQPNGYTGPSSLRKRHVSDDPWRTGTVAWNMLNCFDNLLGFKRDINGFNIDPQLPSEWNELSFERDFRGTIFKINVKKGDTQKVLVDGVEQADSFIEVPTAGFGKKEVTVDFQIEKK